MVIMNKREWCTEDCLRAENKKISLFGVEEQVGAAAVDALAEGGLMDRWIVEAVPLVVEGISAVSSVVSEVDLARVVDHPHQLVLGIFGRLVVVVRYQFWQIQVDRGFHPVV